MVLTENTEVFLVSVRSYLETRTACANSKALFILWEHELGDALTEVKYSLLVKKRR